MGGILPVDSGAAASSSLGDALWELRGLAALCAHFHTQFVHCIHQAIANSNISAHVVCPKAYCPFARLQALQCTVYGLR